MLRYNDKDIDAKLEKGLSEIREVMDRKTYSPSDQAQKIEDLTCLLGQAAEIRAVSFQLCANNEKIAISEKGLKGASITRDVKRYTAYENMLYEYAHTIHEDVQASINALQTLISFAKKAGY